MTDKQDVRMVPVEPTEAMLNAVKPWPKHWPPYDQAEASAQVAFNVDRAVLRSNWTHMLAAAPSVQPDRGVIERLTKFANSLTGEFSSVVIPAKVAKQAADDIRSLLTVQKEEGK